MMCRLVGALGAIAIFASGAAAAAPAGCDADLRCRCAVAVGGTFDPRTNRWRVDEMLQGSWENCISKGLQDRRTTTPAQAKPGSKKRP